MNLTPQDIGQLTPPASVKPNLLQYIASNQKILFLSRTADSHKQQLYEFDCSTGEQSLVIHCSDAVGVTEENLTREEELRRQRARLSTLGITDYLYNNQTSQIVIPLNGKLYHVINHQIESLIDLDHIETPKFSPNGKHIGFVRNSELHVLDLSNSTVKQLTFDAIEHVTNGLAEYIAAEEFDRDEGFWWSPDNSKIAFCKVDSSHIPEFHITHMATAKPEVEIHQYPFAGEANAKVSLGIYYFDNSRTEWLDFNYDNDEEMREFYIVRVFWWSNGDLGAQIVSRKQNRLDLLRFDQKTNQKSIILTERSDYWINVPSETHFLEFDNHFIWISERSGFAHLYLYKTDGTCIHALTQGKWVVDGVLGVDQDKQIVYFTGNKSHPTEKHFYQVPLDAGEVQQITSHPGYHSIILSDDFSTYIDDFSALSLPPRITLCRLNDNQTLFDIHQGNTDPKLIVYNLQPPNIVSFTNRDGDELFGALYIPDESKFGKGPFPTLVYVYGGPHVQLVVNHWKLTCNLRTQYLLQQGFITLIVDNRGSTRRGIEFEGKIKHAFGSVEVQDQIDGAKWLIDQKIADPNRIGITGWSYGGYMTLLCLLRAPEIFSAGVAGAPVTDWDGYDTGYTERYMGTPQSNPEAYKNSSVLSIASQLKSKLLLIHGLLDENVHFRHTARLLEIFYKHGIDCETMFLPTERHGPRLHQAEIAKRMVEFLDLNFKSIDITRKF